MMKFQANNNLYPDFLKLKGVLQYLIS